MILKIQKALNNNNVLIYNKSESIMIQGVLKEVSKYLGNNLKAFVHAKFDENGRLGIVKVAKWQKW